LSPTSTVDVEDLLSPALLLQALSGSPRSLRYRLQLAHSHGFTVAQEKGLKKWIKTASIAYAIEEPKQILPSDIRTCRKVLGRLTGFKPRYYDMCPKGCMSYAGEPELEEC